MFYTYYIKAENKYYFGSRTPEFMLNRDAKDDFMIHYFSSTTDERLKEIIRNKTYEKAEIIKEYTDRQECLKDEERLIKLFWAFYGRLNCWNHRANDKFSTSGTHHSEATKQKLSEAKNNMSDEEKEEWIKKLSESRKGKHHAEATKQKICESRKGTHHSEATKQKMSKARKGKPNSRKGKHHAEATKQKICESLKGKPKPQFYWQTTEGEIVIMNKANAHKYHPDWVLIGPVENNENN